MPEENIEIVRLAYEAYIRGDAEQALSYFHADVAVDFSVRVDTDVTRGREALAEVTSSWIAAWDDYREQIDEIEDLGDKVLLVATQSGRGKGSGVELENQFAQLYEVTDGEITSLTLFDSRERALEAAGKRD